MKRVTMAFGLFLGLTLVGVAIANDFTWSNSASNPGTWHTAANWGGGSNFPGSASPVRTFDRALIDNGPVDGYTVQFTSASGDSATAHGFDSRMISSLVLNAGTNSEDIKVEVATDRLYIDVLRVVTDTNDNIEIEVQSGTFQAREVEIDSSLGGQTLLDFDNDVRFDQTRLTGADIDFDIAPGMTLNLGQVIIEGGSNGTVLQMVGSTGGRVSSS